MIEGSLSLGAFVAFNAYLLRLGRPMSFLGRIIDEYHRAIASLCRIEAVLRQEPQDGDGEDGEPIRGEIEFRHLHFDYNGTRCAPRCRYQGSSGQDAGGRWPSRLGQDYAGAASAAAD